MTRKEMRRTDLTLKQLFSKRKVAIEYNNYERIVYLNNRIQERYKQLEKLNIVGLNET